MLTKVGKEISSKFTSFSLLIPDWSKLGVSRGFRGVMCPCRCHPGRRPHSVLAVAWGVFGVKPMYTLASVNLQVSRGLVTARIFSLSLSIYINTDSMYLCIRILLYVFMWVYMCLYLAIQGCIQLRIRCLKCCWFPASLLLFLGTACQDDDSHLFQQSSKCHFLWISQITPKVERQHLQITVQRIYCFCYSLHSDKCIIQVHSFQFTSH